MTDLCAHCREAFTPTDERFDTDEDGKVCMVCFAAFITNNQHKINSVFVQTSTLLFDVLAMNLEREEKKVCQN